MILIALGSNLPSRFGGPEKTLIAAKEKLTQIGVRVMNFSRIWRSAPVPLSDQPWFCNAVCSVSTDLRPEALMVLLQAVEADFGRIRSPHKNEARILDLDLIAYDDIIQVGDIVLPHPRLHERGFVLFPLRDIAPHWRHPSLGVSVQWMIDALPSEQAAAPLEELVA